MSLEVVDISYLGILHVTLRLRQTSGQFMALKAVVALSAIYGEKESG